MNTEKSKQLLHKALLEISESEALTDARYYIRQALAKIEHVEQKREKRMLPNAQQWRDAISNAVQNPLNPATTLDVLDEMIETEKDKIKQAKQKFTDNETLFD